MANLGDALAGSAQRAPAPGSNIPATSSASQASNVAVSKSPIEDANNALRWGCVAVAVAAAILVVGGRYLGDVRIG